MSQLLIGCAVGALVGASIAAPFLLPWPQHVRYLAATPFADPFLGLTPLVEMRAVYVSAIECDAGRLELTLDDANARGASRITLAHAACAPGVLAQLDGWWALHTPLLLTVDHGRADLYGPDHAVTDLHFSRTERALRH